MGYVVSRPAFFLCSFFVAWVPSTSSLDPKNCISDDTHRRVQYTAGGKFDSDDNIIPTNRMAATYDSTTLVVSSANLATNKFEVVLFGISNFGMERGDSKLTSFAADSVPTAKVAPAVAVSRDNKHLYAYYPADTKLVTYNIADIYNDDKALVVAGASPGPGYYLGTSNGNVVLVDSHNLYIFEEDHTGALVLLNTREISPSGGVSAATGDSTGQYVLAVVFEAISVFDVGGGSIALSQIVLSASQGGEYDLSSSEDGVYEKSPFITITNDSTSIYLQSNGGTAVMLISATFDNSTGVLTLDDTPADASANWSTDFVMAHPDGSALYGGQTANGKLGQYTRNPSDGSLTDECGVDNEANNEFNSVFVAPDGMNVFFAGGDRVIGYRTHTEIPPTPAPTTPAPITPAPTTPAPTTPAPTTLAPTTPAPTTLPPTTPAPTTPAPITPAPSTQAPTRAPFPSPTEASNPPAPLGSPTSTESSQDNFIPALTSAELSETDSSFVLSFNRTCYCTSSEFGGITSSSSFPPALCGQDHQTREFDHGCEIGRLLNAETISFFGENATACQWSNSSSQAVVTFNEAPVSTWDPAPNITLIGRYIYGLANSSSTVQPTVFAEGTVELVLRQPAPELFEARFSNDGASVRVSFSSDGSASSSLLNSSDPGSGSGPGSCDALLNAATVAVIGSGAECEWTGQRELAVWIGFDPVVVADSSVSTTCSGEKSCITLLEGGIRTEAFAVLSSSGSTPIQGPDQPAGVSAVLVAPQEVGLCGEFSLDGRASSGSSSRTLSAVWNVFTADNAGGSALAAVEQALVPFQGSLLATLNATALGIGVEFSFTLTISNFLGAADKTTVTVTRMNDDVPTVVIIGSATKAIKRNRLTTLKMAASPPACEEASSLAYTWAESGVGGYDELGTAFEDLLGSDPTTLIIPPYALDYPGSSYHFKASSSLRSSTTSTSAYVEVTVAQGDLRAFISGGQFRQHTVGADLVLDGSGSSDDDDIPESEFPLTYKWTCSQNCSGVGDEYLSSEESEFVIPGGNLQASLVYEFSLNVTKGTADSGVVYGLLRSDVATVSIEVVSFEAPEVVVAVATSHSGGVKLDPTRRIVIYGGVVEQSSDLVEQSSELLWTQTQGELDIEKEDWSVFFASPQTGTNLVIRPNILTGGSTYTFRLSAVDTVSLATSFAELSILANAAPSGGYIEATPRSGVVALDTFDLECLSWSDDVDDLPLMFSFSTQDDTGVQHAVSVSKTESPEWRGPLPIGRAVDNYTMNIVGHISDGYGATATSLTDASGESVTVRVTGWEAFSSNSSLLDTLVGAYTVAAEGAQYNPGELTSTVRAFASLLMDEINSTSTASPEETSEYQSLVEVMINAAIADFGVVDYSLTSAAAVLDTLALLSSNGDALGTEPQATLLGSSASILDQAVEDGYWDATVKAPTLQLLDGVIGAYSSDSIVNSEEIGDDAETNISRIVESMTLLMEAGLVDGEEAATIESNYVQAACLVTSSTNRMSFATGSSAVTFEAGAITTSPGSSRRRTTALEQPQDHVGCTFGGCASQRRQAVRRRLDQELYSSSSTIVVAQLGFNLNGRASSVVEAGVTQIKVTSTSSGEDIPLAGPVTMLMRASVASTEEIPSCSYYNEETRLWDSSGIVIDSIQELSVGEDGEMDVQVSCLTYHLSDFTVTTTGVEPVFQPVTLTGGVEIFRAVAVSPLGFVLTATAICVMMVMWCMSRAADRRARMAEKLEVKVVDWYIATGEPKRRPTLPDLLGSTDKLVVQRKRERRSQKHTCGARLWHGLKDRFEAWYHRSRAVALHIVEYHPWAGILKPSASNLTLTRGQLAILIFAQVMVQMMVEACFQGNSTDPRVKTTQIVVGLAATMPASIIIPAAFAASASPPASVTVNHDWQQVVFDAAGRAEQQKAGEQGKNRWLRESNNVLAVCYLVAAKFGQKPTPGSEVAHSTNVGATLARGTGLVIYGVANLFLNMACGVLCILIGVDSNLDTALAATVFCSHIQNLLLIDALLSNKATKFSIMSFGVLFKLVFVGLGLTTLQLVLAFYGSRQDGANTVLYGMVVGFSLVKLVVSNLGELIPCMDAINEHSMTQLGYAKRYRRRSSVARRGVSSQAQKIVTAQHRAATVIQSRVRQVLVRKRIIRRKEVLAWHGDSVKGIRKKINNRAYIFLITYTLVVIWINLCYVITYDAPTIWRWTTATSVTVLIDVLLRKPISVLMMSALHTIRDMVHAPYESYIAKGKYRI